MGALLESVGERIDRGRLWNSSVDRENLLSIQVSPASPGTETWTWATSLRSSSDNNSTAILLLSSPPSPLCRVFILTFVRQSISLGNTVLQLFCCYYSCCLYRYFQCWVYCTFTLVLSEVCVQCPIWLFSGVPWLYVFLVCCSRIFWMTLK